jgi:hypothetical protein
MMKRTILTAVLFIGLATQASAQIVGNTVMCVPVDEENTVILGWSEARLAGGTPADLKCSSAPSAR